jgi:hypothetical protein
MQIRVQEFDDQKLYNFTYKKQTVFYKNKKFLCIYPYASQKDLQATGRASSTSKLHFSTFFVDPFCPAGFGSAFHLWSWNLDPANQSQCRSMRIRIHNTA